MTSKKRSLVLLFAAILCLHVQADLVFNNYTSAAGGGNAINAFNSDITTETSAIQFTLSADTIVQSINFTGCYSGQFTIPRPGTDQFTIAFFADDGSTDPNNPAKPIPGPQIGALQSLQITTPATDREDPIVFSLPTFDYAGDLPNPVELVAGTYWISIANDYSGAAGWLMAYSSSGSNEALKVAISSTSQTSGYAGIPTSDAVKPFFSLSGVLAPPDVSIVNESAENLPSDSSVNLGKVLNTTTATKNFTLTNHEPDPVTITAFDQQTSNPGIFSLGGITTPLELASGASANFSLDFTPTTENVAYATRVFFQFDGDTDVEYSLNFSGEGVDTTESFGYDVCTVGGYAGLDALASADPDQDGLSNLATYAFGLTYGGGPRDANGVYRPLIATGTDNISGVGNVGTVVFFLPDPQPIDVIYILEESSTLALGSWDELARKQQNSSWIGAASANVTEDPKADGTLKVRAFFTEPLTTRPKNFMRLRFELAP